MNRSELIQYQQKRDFTKTPEPPAKIKFSRTKPIFVIQKHKASHLHYDLRLEYNGVLKSWAIPKGPSLDPNIKHLAVQVEDHPMDYANFEGLIPAGNYGAGDVIIWDKGYFDFINIKVPAGQIENLDQAKSISFVVYGKKLRGEFVLAKLSRGKKAWLFFKKKDKFANPQAKLDEKSIISGKSISDQKNQESTSNKDVQLKNLQSENFPEPFSPMLATEAHEPFDDKDFIYEIKWDGYRTLAFKNQKNVNLYSRNLLSLNKKFSLIKQEIGEIKDNLVFDGEIVAIQNGLTDFQTLQNSQYRQNDLIYYIFDLLYLNGRDLQSLSLIKRKKLLKNILGRANLAHLKFSDHVKEKGTNLFKIVCPKFEGIIAKKISSRYSPGLRTNNWIKIKSFKSLDAYVVGYTKAKDARPFGSLILAKKEDSQFVYIGNVGTGFSTNQYKLLGKSLQQSRDFPLKNKPPFTFYFVTPNLIVEIKYREITNNNRLRHPVFLRLKDRYNTINTKLLDREMETEIIKTKDKKLEISNPNKIFWPELNLKKIDLARYYLRISNYLLPHLKDRPLSLNRHPNGIDEENFFQKNIDFDVPDFVEKMKIKASEKIVDYMLCQNIESLIFLVNLGCIEINPWLSRKNKLDNPDFMVLDFDPLEIDFKYVIKAVLKTRDLLENAKIKSFVKTSGSTGMHIYIPLHGKYKYDFVRDFAKLIAVKANSQLADFTSIDRNSDNRKNKVYLDFLQNSKGQTLACVYSVRPNKFAGVSTPLQWEEIKEDLDPTNFNIFTIEKRLEKYGDLFQPILESENDLEKALALL